MDEFVAERETPRKNSRERLLERFELTFDCTRGKPSLYQLLRNGQKDGSIHKTLAGRFHISRAHQAARRDAAAAADRIKV